MSFALGYYLASVIAGVGWYMTMEGEGGWQGLMIAIIISPLLFPFIIGTTLWDWIIYRAEVYQMERSRKLREKAYGEE